jgi:hypothetical protein
MGRPFLILPEIELEKLVAHLRSEDVIVTPAVPPPDDVICYLYLHCQQGENRLLITLQRDLRLPKHSVVLFLGSYRSTLFGTVWKRLILLGANDKMPPFPTPPP